MASTIAITASDQDSGQQLYPPVTVDGANVGNAPVYHSATPGTHVVGFGAVPGYLCITPSMMVNVPVNGATGAPGLYRRTS